MSDRAAPPSKSARFTVVVAKCGQPAVHLTLMAPAQDPALRKLERDARVMTVHRAHRGTGADYGVVGIDPEPGAQLLIFPRSLRRFAGKRIVGISYDQVASNLYLTGQPTGRPRPKPAKRAAPPLEPVALFPGPARTVSPDQAADEARSRREPPTLPETLRDLRAIERLLRKKRYAAARDETHRLVAALANAARDWRP